MTRDFKCVYTLYVTAVITKTLLFHNHFRIFIIHSYNRKLFSRGENTLIIIIIIINKEHINNTINRPDKSFESF